MPARKLAALAAVCVLATGCGGGGNRAAERGPTSTTTAGSGTGSTLLGPATTDPLASSSASSTTAAGPAFDVGPARAAWERWARAVGGGDLAGASGASRDAANGWTAVTRVVAQADAAAGHQHFFSSQLSAATLDRYGPDKARLNASLDLTERSDQFTRTVHISTPFLSRVDGVWTLIAFDVDGKPVAWSAIGTSRTADGVTTELTALLTAGNATYAITQTSAGGDVAFDRAAGELTTPDGAKVPSRSHVFVGTRQATGVWRFPATARVQAVRFVLTKSDKALDFSF
jgi:hypothetical protein